MNWLLHCLLVIFWFSWTQHGTQAVSLGSAVIPGCAGNATYDADKIYASRGKCAIVRGCIGSAVPALNWTCNETCQVYYTVWYCFVLLDNCIDTCAYESVNRTLYACRSSFQRLFDNCAACGAVSGSIESYAARYGVIVVDDSDYPASRTCSYPGCKCDNQTTCLSPCQYDTEVGCINPWFVNTESSPFCFDFYNGLTDPYFSNYSARSDRNYTYVLAQVCGIFTAQTFINLCVTYLGVDPLALQVTTKCGSVIVNMFCVGRTSAEANQVCRTVDDAINDPNSPLSEALRTTAISPPPPSSKKNEEWLWSLFGLLLLAALLLGALICWKKARHQQSMYTHYKDTDVPRVAQSEAGPDPQQFTTLATMLPAGDGKPFWLNFAPPSGQDRSGQIQPFQHSVAYPSYAVADTYVAHVGTRWYGDNDNGIASTQGNPGT